MKQQAIYETIESLVPTELWEKYKHLSFGEMAEIPELGEYSDKLKQAEIAWFEAEDA